MKSTAKIVGVVGISALFCLTNSSRSSAAPDLSVWRINATDIKGHSPNATIDSYVSQINADVKELWYTSSNIYVKSSGVPSYDVGPFGTDPAYPADQNWLFRINRNPQPAAAGTNTATPLGPIGVFLNGVPLFNPKDAMTYHNQNIWHQNAAVVEADDFDTALGHPAPQQGSTANPPPGAYHHHQLSPSLDAQLGGDSPTHFSPLIGYAFDGYPIYGPYGYTNANGTGGISLMSSSYHLRNITQRHTLPDGTALAQAQWGPDVSTQYPLGYYIEDYVYTAGSGALDQYNGRFTVTPEYPGGTYAYFGTIVENGGNAYPYLLGPSYYGVADTANFNRSVTIPGDAVQFVPEPSSVVLAGLGTLIAGICIRRQRLSGTA